MLNKNPAPNASTPPTPSTWDDKDEEKNVRIGGIISAGVGLVLLGVGIPLAILTETHVKVNDRKVANTAPRLGPSGLVF